MSQCFQGILLIVFQSQFKLPYQATGTPNVDWTEDVATTSINHKTNSFSRHSGQSNVVTVQNLNTELSSGNEQLFEERRGKKEC